MKKIIVFLVMLGVVVVLASCGSSSEPNSILEREPVLDFRSILDTELNLMFSIGDYRGDIEAVLGQPIGRNERDGAVEYKTRLSVLYENDIAVSIAAVNLVYIADYRELEISRFEIIGLQANMTLDEISINFEAMNVLEGFYSFHKFFNEFGDSTDREFAYVRSSVMWMEEYDFLAIAMTVSLYRTL